MNHQIDTTVIERMIREKLELVDAAEMRLRGLLKLGERIEREGRAFVARDVERSTGRTTNVIVKALVHLALNPTALIGFKGKGSGRYGVMERQAREWAARLGLDPSHIVSGQSANFALEDHE
jgi:hypothetical protein